MSMYLLKLFFILGSHLPLEPGGEEPVGPEVPLVDEHHAAGFDEARREGLGQPAAVDLSGPERLHGRGVRLGEDDDVSAAVLGRGEVLRGEPVAQRDVLRVAELLRDDLDAKGPVRVSEVETAQKEVLTIARRMAESGEIVLGGAGGEAMI